MGIWIGQECRRVGPVIAIMKRRSVSGRRTSPTFGDTEEECGSGIVAQKYACVDMVIEAAGDVNERLVARYVACRRRLNEISRADPLVFERK